MAQANAKPENGYGEVNARIDQAFKDIQALQSSMEKALQEIDAVKKAIEEGGSTVTPPEEPVVDEWPEWYPWNGISLNPWQYGVKCTHNGNKVHFPRVQQCLGTRRIWRTEYNLGAC